MKTKILIGILLVFLIMGAAATVSAKDLKAPRGYEEEAEGYWYFIANEDQHLYVGFMDVNHDIFNNSTGYTVCPVGENFYAFNDTEYDQYGIQEMVVVDGEEYLVSIHQKTPLTDTQMSVFKDDLTSFNMLNDVKPVAV